MLTKPLSDPIWVERPQGLQDMLSHLMQQPFVAVDTESNSLYVYQEQVCLIQLSSPTRDYLVDPLTLPDLSSLTPFFASPDIQKIFHAADYDLVCLKRDFDFEIVNIFDTMIAGRALGMPSVGLAAMLEEAFAVQLDKRYQRANWGQRPLKKEMLAYARLDSHYLIALREILVKRLEKQGRLLLVEEDCARLAKNSLPMQNHKADMWHIRGVSDLKSKQLAAMQAVYDFREHIAQSENKPPFKIMSNQAMLEVAQTMPRYMEELHLLPSLSKHQVRRFGKGLLQAVQKSPSIQVVGRTGYQRPDEALIIRNENLGKWRRLVGLRLGVQSDVVLPRDVMNRIAEENPQTLQDLGAVMHDAPQRFRQYGEDILQVLIKGQGL